MPKREEKGGGGNVVDDVTIRLASKHSWWVSEIRMTWGKWYECTELSGGNVFTRTEYRMIQYRDRGVCPSNTDLARVWPYSNRRNLVVWRWIDG